MRRNALRDCRKVLCLAFPDHKHIPTEAHKLGADVFIPRDVAGQLRMPILSV